MVQWLEVWIRGTETRSSGSLLLPDLDDVWHVRYSSWQAAEVWEPGFVLVWECLVAWFRFEGLIVGRMFVTS